jgi:hypothetical protein
MAQRRHGGAMRPPHREDILQKDVTVVEQLTPWRAPPRASWRPYCGAVNQGDDADTTGAVCGQLAGAYWGWPSQTTCWTSSCVSGSRTRSATPDVTGDWRTTEVCQNMVGEYVLKSQ